MSKENLNQEFSHPYNVQAFQLYPLLKEVPKRESFCQNELVFLKYILLTMFNHNIHLIYYNFYLDGLIQIGYHEGVSNVWAGTIPSLVLVSQPTIKFTVYEFLKRYYLQLYGKIISRVIFILNI